MSIQVNNITHIYGKGLPHESVALHNVSFSVEDGEFVAIIGHTGSGKSTLLQHLDGLLKPDEGSIVVDGVEITAPGTSLIEIRRRIGLVFQYPEYQLFEETVAKDVAFGPGNLHLTEEEIQERVQEGLAMVGLSYEKIKDKSPFDFSGGEKRRIAIAGVLAMRPQVLILDEPTAGLDPKAHREILETVKNYHEKSGAAIILVSHNMNDVAKYAEKVIVMEKGSVLMQGTPTQVFSRGEELRKIGLDVPELTTIAARLTAAGLSVPENIYTCDAMCQAIVTALKHKDQQPQALSLEAVAEEEKEEREQ